MCNCPLNINILCVSVSGKYVRCNCPLKLSLYVCVVFNEPIVYAMIS